LKICHGAIVDNIVINLSLTTIGCEMKKP